MMDYSLGFVYVPSSIIFFCAAVIFCFTRSIPHFGHLPGLSLITSLCMVHVYISSAASVSFCVLSLLLSLLQAVNVMKLMAAKTMNILFIIKILRLLIF